MFLNKNSLKNLRLKNAWSQQHLADLCGLNIRTIQRVERDGIASFETTMALANAFNVPKDQLLMRIEPNSRNHQTKILIFFLGILIGACIAKLLI
jgi:transcriptional regulator with XRE-family HTH domain